MAYNEDSSASGHDEPWIQWFCGLKGHEMFCEVERSYIEDGFNLYGLRACVSNFSDCLDLILDRIGPDDSDDSHLTQSACTLYGLIHARYIITAHGLDAMYNKYAAKEFGTCPLIQCNGQPVLPVGLRDEMGADTVKIYCPRCQSVYHPPPIRSRSSHHGPGTASGTGAAFDGAAFGTTFPHLFLMTFNNLVPDPLDSKSKYVPKVFGFRVHHSARQRVTPGGSTGGGSGAAAGLPSSTTVPQGNVGRSRHASGGSAAAAALARSGGGRASVGGSAAAAAGAAGPSSPPVEVGLPAVSADGKQNGKAGNNGNGNFKVTRGATAGAAAGGAGGSKSSGSGGPRIKNTAAKGGSVGGAKGGGSAGGGGKAKANSTGGAPEKRKAASGAKANADGVKGGGAGDNNSTGSRAKRSKKAAAGAS